MANDALEASLIDGGLPAAAAKILSNAIGNVSTGRTYFGRQTEDATPIARMRLIDGDTRRYVLTNLDNPSEKALKERLYSTASQYGPSTNAHPYEGSQPSTANPTLNTDAVTPGSFVDTQRKTEGEVAQAKVGLKIDERGGDHARMNKATGKIETVPFFLDCVPKSQIEGEIIEEDNRTVIRIRLL
jgi:hypothetical protein